MEVVYFRTDGWRSGPVIVTTNFFERWRGLRGTEPETAMLIEANSVHGVGMDREFLAIGLSTDYRVVETRSVSPGRFARFRRCKWILELPVGVEPPEPGQTLELVDD